MTDDFEVVREKLTNEPWFDEAEAALDRIEARLNVADTAAMGEAVRAAEAEAERDKARADAERLRALVIENVEKHGNPISHDLHAALAAHEEERTGIQWPSPALAAHEEGR